MLHLNQICHISLLIYIHLFPLFLFFFLSNSDLKSQTISGFFSYKQTKSRLFLGGFVKCLTVIQTQNTTVHQPPQRTRRSLNFIKHSSFLFQSVSHSLSSSYSTWFTSVVVALICLLSECELLLSPATLFPRYTHSLSLYLSVFFCFHWWVSVMIWWGFINIEQAELGLSKELREMLPIVVFRESFSVMDSQWVSSFFHPLKFESFCSPLSLVSSQGLIARNRYKCNERKL